MKNLLSNFKDGKFQTAIALIVAEVLVTLVPALAQYGEVLQQIVIVALAAMGFDALQKGLSIKFNVSDDVESREKMLPLKAKSKSAAKKS